MNQSHSWPDFSLNPIFDPISKSILDYYLQVKSYTIDTVEHLILSAILYILICIILYIAVTKWKCFVFKKGINGAKRVLFVIAHPDDECMFFGPTILHFTRQDNTLVYLMCLSTGRYNGMGSTRKDELYASCKALGIDENCIVIHDHTCLPDAMDIRWPTEILSKLILSQVETFDINTLITFDRHGISRHSNHYSIYYAVANLIIERKLPKKCVVFVLESVNIIRKYWLIFDLPISYLLSRFRFLVSFQDRRTIMKAMKNHKSQLVWFRYLYIYLSRYLLINTLQEMNLVDIELDLDIDD